MILFLALSPCALAQEMTSTMKVEVMKEIIAVMKRRARERTGPRLANYDG